MTDLVPTGEKPSLRDYLAAERTLLAWIRTGLALMGFGFVVARFGLFLQQIMAAQHGPMVLSFGLSLWFGVALIMLGVVVNVLSAWSHTRLVRGLGYPDPAHARPSIEAVAIALILALVGLAMAIYLVSVRRSTQVNPALSEVNRMEQSLDNGIVKVPSHHSVDETVARLQGILQAKGVNLFALVDHSGEAEKAGLKMPSTKLVIFGSPKAGTPVMLASPSIAIDLPLKILVAEDEQGAVWVSYNRPAYLQQRHGVPPELLANISVVGALAAKAAE